MWVTFHLSILSLPAALTKTMCWNNKTPRRTTARKYRSPLNCVGRVQILCGRVRRWKALLHVIVLLDGTASYEQQKNATILDQEKLDSATLVNYANRTNVLHNLVWRASHRRGQRSAQGA